MNATAKDKTTGREQTIAITASTNLNKADVERICMQIAELQQAMMVLGQAMYGGATASGADSPERPGGNGHGGPRDEDVIEGEYRDM